MLALALAAGCAEDYYYTPQVSNAQQNGLPASRIDIPPEQPNGSVQITSGGIAQVKPDAGGKVDVIHVRMVVSNDNDPTPWTVDTSQQILEIPKLGRSAPLFANSDARTMPKIVVARGERHVIDLYYPVPANMKESKLPEFDVVWNVVTGTRPIASRTVFDRAELQYAYDDSYWGYPYGYGYYAGWGPFWYSDPFFGGVAFVNTVPVHVHDVHGAHVSGFHGGYAGSHGGMVAHGGGGGMHGGAPGGGGMHGGGGGGGHGGGGGGGGGHR